MSASFLTVFENCEGEDTILNNIKLSDIFFIKEN